MSVTDLATEAARLYADHGSIKLTRDRLLEAGVDAERVELVTRTLEAYAQYLPKLEIDDELPF